MNFSALGISYVKANKLFLSHLHIDHMGDFDPWYVGDWIEARLTAVWKSGVIHFSLLSTCLVSDHDDR